MTNAAATNTAITNFLTGMPGMGSSWSSLVVLYGLTLGVLVLVAVWRGAGSETYSRMPLHLVGVTLIALVLKSVLHLVLGIPETAGTLRVTGWWYLLLMPAVAFLWAVLRYRSMRPAGDAHKRGAVVLGGDEAQREVRQTQRLKRQHGEQLLTLAGVWVAPDDETKHFKLVGTTGAGKSTAIRELLHQALARGDRAVIADPDGGYLARFYDRVRGDVILNPFDARSHRWNAFLDMVSTQDADLLARSLIPEGTGDREWGSYARTFLGAVLRQCQKRGMAGQPLTSGEIWRLVATASTDELRPLLQGTAAQPFLEPDNARMFGSIRSIASSAVAALEYVDAQAGVDFSVREWVRSGRGVLFLPYQADQISALRTLIATWMRLAIFQTMSQGEGDHRLWFVVDELDALGQIDGLKDALARLRKFGGRCVLGFQSIAQVSSTYGDGPARTIVENCSNSLILRCSASEGGGTARFASGLIGKREVIRQTVTQSTAPSGGLLNREVDRGTSYGEDHRVEDAVLASEIEALPDRVGYLKFASRPQWRLVEFPYFDVDKRAAPFEGVVPGGTDWGNSGSRADLLGSVDAGAAPSCVDLEQSTEKVSALRRAHAELEDMRSGARPMPEGIAEALQAAGMTLEEFIGICQAATEDVAGQGAAALGLLARLERQEQGSVGVTDYVEVIKRLAAQGREMPE